MMYLKSVLGNIRIASTRIESRLRDLPDKIAGQYNLGAIAKNASNIAKILDTTTKGNETRILTGLLTAKSLRNPEPPSTEEWCKAWMEQKHLIDEEAPEEDTTEDGTTKDDTTETCTLCCTNKANTILRSCQCKSALACASCLLKHYYKNSENCLKTSGTCPFCRSEIKLDDIVPTKENYVRSMIKIFSVGKLTDEPTKDCKVCGKRPADARMSCCESAMQITKCAECLLEELYNKEYSEKRPTCDDCKSTHTGIMILRPFPWSQQESKRQKI
jgi:hypothetical protein